MIKANTVVYVECTGCGFGITVGDGEDPIIPFNASEAETAEEGAWRTLTEHYGYTYDEDTEEIFCPVCSHKGDDNV